MNHKRPQTWSGWGREGKSERPLRSICRLPNAWGDKAISSKVAKVAGKAQVLGKDWPFEPRDASRHPRADAIQGRVSPAPPSPAAALRRASAREQAISGDPGCTRAIIRLSDPDPDRDRDRDRDPDPDPNPNRNPIPIPIAGPHRSVHLPPTTTLVRHPS